MMPLMKYLIVGHQNGALQQTWWWEDQFYHTTQEGLGQAQDDVAFRKEKERGW